MLKKYLSCILIFAKIGVCSFGGGYTMLPLFQSELVKKRHWLTEEQLTDYFAFSQCQPGPSAINMSVLTAGRQYGPIGGICGAIGMMLPSFLIILLLAMLMNNFATIPLVAHALNGIKVVVAGLVLYSAYTIGKTSIKNISAVVIFIAALILTALNLINTLLIIVAAAAAGIIIGLIKKKRQDHKEKENRS